MNEDHRDDEDRNDEDQDRHFDAEEIVEDPVVTSSGTDLPGGDEGKGLDPEEADKIRKRALGILQDEDKG